MNEATKFIGIDISKDTFDVHTWEGKHKQFSNDSAGYKRFRSLIDSTSHCVMEATGSYHHQLAIWLYSNGYAVSVLNPLSVKRFAQMRLRIAKTDKADAKIIYQYALLENPETWNPPAEYIAQAFEINGVLSLLIKQRTALKNKKHSVSHKFPGFKTIIKSVQKMIADIDKQIEILEQTMENLIRTHEESLFQNLCTIPGIGKKTALFLIVITNGFSGFESSKQLSSYLGLAPTLRISGKSVRGLSRISKAGNGTIRNLLFMCSFTASKSNKSCSELFDRMVEKGKPKKVALIAVANKLLKQAFAIAKHQTAFEPAYQSFRHTH